MNLKELKEQARKELREMGGILCIQDKCKCQEGKRFIDKWITKAAVEALAATEVEVANSCWKSRGGEYRDVNDSAGYNDARRDIKKKTKQFLKE